MFRLCLTLILTLATLPTLAADDPDVRQLMTAEEFAAAGLSRLSTEEMDAINLWLVRYTAEDAAKMIKSSPAVKEITRGDVRSRVDGAFTGWNGTTRFHLKNGQVWETRSSKRYSYSATDPEVEISRTILGQYRMRVLDTDRAVMVRRIQ